VGLLSDIRVLEVVAAWGQYAGKLLADLGAEVIKVEPPGGDPARQQALAFAYYNTNKKSVVLDLEQPAGRAGLRELLSSADVLLTTFDRGRTSALLPDDAVNQPGLVVVTLSGFGTTGPAAAYRASNVGVFAMSGQMLAVGNPEGPPAAPPGQMALDLGAVDAVIGTLSALLARARNGRGQRVEVAASEVLAGQNSSPERESSRTRSGNTHPQLAPSGVYQCRDGAVEITVVMPAQWDALKKLLDPCPALARAEWDDRSRRARDHLEIERLVAAAIAARYQAETVAEAQRLRLPCLPVHTLSSFMDDPHVRARGYFVMGLGEYPLAGPPYRLSNAGWALRRGAPRVGEHTAEVVSRPAPSHHASGPDQPRMPLEGVRVVTFSTAFAGPTLSRYLADYGAEVIKVESKRRPDNTRGPERDYVEPSGVTTSLPFTHFNRNKRSLAVDMSHEEGRKVVQRLIEKTDVVVENFSLSVMKRWGFDYASLRAIRSDLIMLDMQGLGQSGPHSTYITYGPTLHSYSGLTSVWGFSHPWFVDYVAAEHGVVAILSALWHRRRTGAGTHIDLAQVEALASLLGVCYLEDAANSGAGAWSGATDAPQGCYPCRGEDAWCAIAVQCAEDWQAFACAVGHADWTRMPAFATSQERLAHAAELDSLVADWTRDQEARAVERRLQDVGVSAVAVRAVHRSALRGAWLLRDTRASAHRRQRLPRVVHPPVRHAWPPLARGATVGPGQRLHPARGPAAVR
jgi:crotonobetainyl-CoA:carnitine CoA-transferase CaiB-like acyl-CoA transferase